MARVSTIQASVASIVALDTFAEQPADQSHQ
jgi:hypothetical protein